MAFHRFCKSIVEHQPLHIYGDGQQTRDFTYISDVIEANIRAATRDGAVGEVMNIAGGSCVPLYDVIGLLQKISGTSIDVVFEEKQHGDARDTYANTERAKQLIGYKPLVPLHEGLAEEFAYIASLYRKGTQAITV
jgi:UDP-glucose 4-epimerase